MQPLVAANLLTVALTGGALVALIAVARRVERWSATHVSRRLGWNGVLLTGWLGVPVHELSHLVVAKLFGHRIVAWRLLDPDPVTGTLGYVRHAHSRPTAWQLAGNFFIGIAPLVGGALALLALLTWMAPPRLVLAIVSSTPDTAATPTTMFSAAAELAHAIWEHRSPYLPLQLYLGACVASHWAPSATDLREGLTGFGVFALALAATAALLGLAGVDLSASPRWLAPAALALVVTAAFQALWVCGVALVYGLTHRQA